MIKYKQRLGLIVFILYTSYFILCTSYAEQVKIELDEDGIYRLPFRELIDAGVNLNQNNIQTFRLFNKGIEIPLYLNAESKTKGYLEFYGEKHRNPDGKQNEYTDTNVYYLKYEVQSTKDEGQGTKSWSLETSGLVNAGVLLKETPAYFLANLERKETNIYSRTAGESGNLQDLWFWREISAPAKDDSYVFTISNLAPDTTLHCSLNVEFKGISRVGTTPNHYVVINLNGNRIGEARWDNQNRYVYQSDTVLITYFNEGKNILQISLPGKAGDPTGQAPDIDVIYMVQFKVAYWKTYTATNNELTFTKYQVPSTKYQIHSFTNPKVKVYDISNCKIILPQVTFNDHTDKYTVEFSVLNEDSASNYIALADARKKEPVKIEKIYEQDLSQDTSGAEYLVITHDDFYSAIQPLVDWRKKTGLTTKLVKISEIYDSFNYGLIDPKAIRAFISHTYKNWKPIPKYVLLVGDVSIDLRGNMNQANARLFIPTYYWGTYMGAAASDNWYVSVNGTDDAKPVMAIGRISAHSVTEVYNVVNKILQYEQKPVYGPWRQQLLFLASPEGMFEGISEELAKQYVPPSYEVYRRYPSSGSPDYKYRTEDIVGNINDGRVILHFTGHGGGYVWESGRMDLERHGVEVVPDNRDFFGFKNLTQLTNIGKYPLTIALTCYTGVFDNIDNDSLGEMLLKTPNAGAIAVISATWRSYVSSNDSFDRAMFSQLFKKNVRRVGDIFLGAKQEINIPETSATYILLGDPATTISIPKETIPLTAVRKSNPKNAIEVQGTFDKKQRIKGTVVLKTEKGKVVAEKKVSTFYSQRFIAQLPIPTQLKDSTLTAYCYLWNDKTGWDAIGYSIVSATSIDSATRRKNIALSPLLPSIIWSVVSRKIKDAVDIKQTPQNDIEQKANQAFEEGNRYYKQKNLVNAMLKYSESFDFGLRTPALIKNLQKIIVPIETFETATAVQINHYYGGGKLKEITHEISSDKSRSGKKSELIELDYPQSGWFDYWSKEINIPLRSPLGIRAYVCSTALDTKLELIALVAVGKTHWVVFSSQMQSIGSQWTELKIDDLYKVARKRALASADIEEFKVYPDLYVASRNLDANPEWDVDDMRILKVGVNTGGKSAQFWIDDIELFFPRDKLRFYR